LCEQHSDNSNSFYRDNWIHNFKLLFGKFVSSEKIKFTKIPKEIWGGDWGEFGYIIEIAL
jgi:hypothetical protein